MKKKLVSALLCAGMVLSGLNTVNVMADEEMPNLVINFVWSAVPADVDMIEDAINEITTEKIGCTVTLNAYTYGNVQDQQTLILSSPDEQWDVMLGMFRSGIQGFVAKGQLTPLNDLLEEYGQDIVDVLGEDYIKACSIDGECYEITTCRNLAGQECVLFRKDLIDEIGMADEVAAVTSYADLTPIFAAIHEAHPELYITASSGTKPNLLIKGLDDCDNLGDSLGVLLNSSEATVSNMFESDAYKELCELTKGWNEAGYIYPDITTDDSNNGATLMQNNLCASYFTSYKPGALVENQNQTGYELTAALVDQPLALTSSVQNWGWAIPTNAKYPEKAMQFMNLLFSDEELVNLLSYGIEDYHWTLNAEGFATDGEHSDGYADKSTWKSGNAYMAKVWNGDDADLYEQLKAFNTDAKKSVALGFSFDSSDYTTEYTAMQSVISQYRMLLEWGFVSDVDATLSEFNQALYDAGLQKYMDAKQEQLNAFLAE